MNLLTILQNIFSILSSVMLYPVMILLIVFFFWMMITLGGFVQEYLERRKQARRYDPKKLIDSCIESCQEIQNLSSSLKKEMPYSFQEYFHEILRELKERKCGREVHIEYLLQNKEQKMAKSLDKLRLMVRVGPTLGLMGTIIPMGPALSALSQGNLEKLSDNIIIAFTTTVLGLAIGIIAYFLSMIKNRWVHEDIKNLEYFTECVMQNEIL